MSHPRLGRLAPAAALVVPFALAAIAAGALSAQEHQGSSTATLRFRALTGDGGPAADLKPDDVTLRIDGRPREIQSLEFVDLRGGGPPAAPSAGAPAAPKATVPPPYSTNVVAAASGDGRDLYLLVDEESIAPGRETSVKEALKELIGVLSPRDRASLVSVRQGGPNVGLSTDVGALQQGLDKLAGYANSRETAEDLTCRTSRSIQMIQSVLQSAGGKGLPTVVFFSTQIATLNSEIRTMQDKQRIEDLCQLRTEHFQRLGTAASNANATFFSVELLDASSSPPSSAASGGLDNLAGSMGGETIRMGVNVAEQMARIARATAGYYVATFAADPGDRSGNRRVEISVARSGVSVKAPRELTAGRGSGAGKPAGPVTPREMIRSPSQFPDLPLRAAAFASRNPGDDKVRVLALLEPLDAAAKIRSAMVGLFDQSGNLVAQWTAQAQELTGPTTVAALIVPNGTYRVRAAATDGSGRAGAVDVNGFQASLLESGSIKLGDLVLGKAAGSGLVPALQFSSEAEAIAMLELYGRPTSPLKMYVEVVGAPGDPIQLPLTPSATNEQDKFILSAKLPITALPAGDYAVRAIVGVEGEKEGTVTATLRKVKSGS